MPHFPETLDAGKPYPLGATWDGLGVNFAVFSAHAEKIELCVFDVTGRHEVARYTLPQHTDEIWHGHLPSAAPGLLYGYRAYGPYNPAQGHRFNPAKLLLDPYAKGLAGELRWTDALFGYRIHSGRADLSMDRRDSASFMPKAIVLDDHYPWENDKRPNTPWSETVIYEAHVRGMTKLLEKAPPQQRGTLAGLTHASVLDHLKRLGITAIELMPIHAYLQDRTLVEKGLGNYWGYNTLAYFAVEPRYLFDPSPREMREMVRRYHAAGIEVILDVVYNHTCEGSELGPTLSWRGFDNANYYRLADDQRYVINDTGTGNTLNLLHPRVLQMVLDSLRYWADTFHVDGFRFDLGLTLGREKWGFDTHSGFFDALRQDPVLSSLKLITEPWDVGPGGYQLGHFPPGFSEWNDRYRDGLRKYWRGDGAMRPEVAARLTGSGDIFDTKKRKPYSSINYMASHDGFTLHDLVSYEHKHNEANGEENKDGQSENYSSNYGAEGPTDKAEIIAYRERVKRSMLTALFGSLGAPMLLMGDECGRTQNGNNNAYCQDNETSWFDWKLLDTDNGRQLADFTARLIALRKHLPTLRCCKFLSDTADVGKDLQELSWYDERGVKLSKEDWDNAEGRVLIMRRAEKQPSGTVQITALMLNADANTLQFKLPGDYPWRVLIDSGKPAAGEQAIEGNTYQVEGRAAVILAAETKE
jgi:glycogen operon protein